MVPKGGTHSPRKAEFDGRNQDGVDCKDDVEQEMTRTKREAPRGKPGIKAFDAIR